MRLSCHGYILRTDFGQTLHKLHFITQPPTQIPLLAPQTKNSLKPSEISQGCATSFVPSVVSIISCCPWHWLRCYCWRISPCCLRTCRRWRKSFIWMNMSVMKRGRGWVRKDQDLVLFLGDCLHSFTPLAFLRWVFVQISFQVS